MQITPELVAALAAAIVAIITAIRQGRMKTESSENHAQTQLQLDDVARLIDEGIRASTLTRGAVESLHSEVRAEINKGGQS